jgi:hypothetical protein
MSLSWITPKDADYDAARMPWNVAVDQRPVAVVRAASADDIADAVRTAKSRGLRVMMQNTGHAATGRHDLSGAVVVRTNAMTDVTVDPDTAIARVAAGAQWQAVAEAAAPHGLAGLAGSSGGVGVVGYTIGGGLGWLGRAHGFACGKLLAADVVLASGKQVRIDDTNEPDLMWALRGGGGCFAAVTSVDIGLVQATQFYGGTLFFPAERTTEVLTAWSTWVDTVPETVTSTARVLNIPPLETVPEPLRGRSFVVVQAVCLLPESDAADLLAPLRALTPEIDTFATMAAPELGMIHMDPPEPVPADLEGWLVDRFDADVIASVVANSGPGSPLLGVQVRHLGGALSRPGPLPAALDSVDAGFAIYGVGVVPEPAAATAVRRALTQLGLALRPAASKRGFMNFAEQASANTLFPSDVVSRMTQVRTAYDLDRRFMAAHNVG